MWPFKRNKKDIIEIVPEATEGSKGSIKDFVDGSFLTRDVVVNQLPYIFFLTFLGIMYIGNRNHAETIVRKSNKLQTELKELRSEAIATASELMYISKQSEVVKMVEENQLNLIESVEPPIKIIASKTK